MGWGLGHGPEYPMNLQLKVLNGHVSRPDTIKSPTMGEDTKMQMYELNKEQGITVHYHPSERYYTTSLTGFLSVLRMSLHKITH